MDLDSILNLFFNHIFDFVLILLFFSYVAESINVSFSYQLFDLSKFLFVILILLIFENDISDSLIVYFPQKEFASSITVSIIVILSFSIFNILSNFIVSSHIHTGIKHTMLLFFNAISSFAKIILILAFIILVSKPFMSLKGFKYMTSISYIISASSHVAGYIDNMHSDLVNKERLGVF